jgi:hypothetical protein
LVASVLFLPWGSSPLVPTIVRPSKTKEADVTQHPKAFGHVGLLFNEPPGRAGLFFV